MEGKVLVGQGRGRGRGRARNLELNRQCNTIMEEDIPVTRNVSNSPSKYFEEIPSKPEVPELDEEPCSPTRGKARNNFSGDNESSLQVCRKDEPGSQSSSKSIELSVTSISTVSSPTTGDSSKESWHGGFRKYPLSYFLPKYFECIKPSQRLNTLTSSRVKVLKVLNKRGNLYVAFQDKDSLTRFNCLLEQMGSFYTSPEGLALLKPGKFLENGEIVAATVSTCSDVPIYRRVKIQRILEGEGSFKACTVDIDNLSHWNIRTAFALHEAFYNHPCQACRIRIRNHDDLYPKGIFEELFDDHARFLEVMNELTHMCFTSLIGRDICKYFQHLSIK